MLRPDVGRRNGTTVVECGSFIGLMRLKCCPNIQAFRMIQKTFSITLSIAPKEPSLGQACANFALHTKELPWANFCYL